MRHGRLGCVGGGLGGGGVELSVSIKVMIGYVMSVLSYCEDQ